MKLVDMLRALALGLLAVFVMASLPAGVLHFISTVFN